MRKAIRKNRYIYSSGRLKEKLFSNKRIIFLTAVFTAGVVAGSVIISKDNTEIVNYIVDIFKSYTLQRGQQKLISGFLHSAVGECVYILISYFLGLSVMGLPAICALPFVKGLGTGVVLGYLYSSFKWKGVGYSLLIIFPGMLTASLALIFACGESLAMSAGLLSVINGNKAPMLKDFFKIYNIRYLVFFLVSLFASLLDAVLMKSFSGLFSF